jgi:hypothetical protein
MKITIKILMLVTLFVLSSSFTHSSQNSFIGTFGVMASNPSQIKLVLNADHTFYYQDFSVSTQKIIVDGKWTLKGKNVLLQTSNTNKRFHNVWSFEKNGTVAKSRKGLTYYRLCRIEG